MKFQVALSALVACASFTEASPMLKKKKTTTTSSSSLLETSTTSSETSTEAASTTTTRAARATPLFQSLFNGTANGTANGTLVNVSNSSNSSAKLEANTLQFIVTGGSVPIFSNASYPEAWNVTQLSNSSQTLNLTQMYAVVSNANETISQNQTKGVVLVTNSKSLESLGFLAAVVIDNTKPIVIADDAKIGALVANSSKAANRGALVVGENNLVYPAVLSPSSGSTVGVPVAAIDDDMKINWFFEPSMPALIANNSAIRSNFSNFTYGISQEQGVPVVPIVYDGSYSSGLISTFTSVVSGLVVVESGATNATIGSPSVPVVFAQAAAPLVSVSQADVPVNATSAGYLSPVKAQILLSIAAVNGVNSREAISEIFA